VTPTLALQIALRSALLSAPTVTELIGPGAVLDDVPQGTRPPYLHIGDLETRDWSTQTSRGHEHFVTLHVWSNHRSRKQCYELIDAIDTTLAAGGLALTGHVLVSLSTIFWTVLHELGNGLYHGIMRLRAVTEPNIDQGE
jgi:hypothetical protein